MANHFKPWFYSSLLVLNALSYAAFAELAPTSYVGFTATNRCTDLQTVINSHLELSQRQHCGNRLTYWQQWLAPQTRDQQYQWCLQQPANTIDELKNRLDKDFFYGNNPAMSYTTTEFKTANLCVRAYYSYHLGDQNSYASNTQINDEPPSPYKPFQVISPTLRQFIISVEANGHFRQTNPLRQLYPSYPNCQLKGTPIPLNLNQQVQQWLIVPDEACWQVQAYRQEKQFWPQRLWLVEQNRNGTMRLLLEEDAATLVLYTTQTSGYYDFTLLTNSDSTFSAGKQFDPLSYAALKKRNRKYDNWGGYGFQRFHYNAHTQRYETPDKGTVFF
jgi:hypothetical protein